MARTERESVKVETVEEEAPVSFDDASIDEAFESQETEVKSVPTNSVDTAAILASLDLDALIQKRVQEQLAEQSRNQSNPIVDATTRAAQAAQPARYLKHYRCDLSPDAQIQRRIYDPGSDSLTGVVKGKWIKFRRGHFFATEQSEVDQIEWMIRHPALDPQDTSIVIGGNPHIYEDDGRDVVACAYCGEPFVSGSNALKSHLRATHGVSV